MPDTGWIIASAGANVAGGSTDWVNPGNVTIDDGSAATVTPGSGGSSDPLRATFDLSALIPVGATIDGVEVRFQVSRSAAGPEEGEVRLVVGGSAVGADRSQFAAFTGTPTNYDRGGASDLWGTTITRDQAVGTDFGFQFTVNDSDSASETTSCDAMWVKITYTEAAPAGGGSFFF